MLKLFVTDLASYNEGSLVGKWVTLPMDEDELRTEIKAILTKGEEKSLDKNHEEFFITDYEWENDKLFSVDEYDNPYELNNKMEALSNLDEDDLKKVKFLMSIGHSCNEAVDNIDNVTYYNGQSLVEVVDDMIDDGLFGEIPDSIKFYIDTAKLARDLELGDGYHENSDGVFHYN